MPSYAQQWLPYLGDMVAIRTGALDLSGTTTRYDAALVDVATPGTDMEVGASVGVAWRVGTAVHRCTGRVEEVHDGGFSVRLAAAPTQTSRRTCERVRLSVPVVVSSSQHGSFGTVARQGRTLDLSDGGMRALLDTEAGFGVGQIVEVEVELGGQVQTLHATVVWENAHGAGERMAGLAFATAVDTTSWRALSQR